MDYKEYIENLKKIGFTEQEAKIYLALLENGPLTIARIASESHIHRPTVYKLIPNMVKKSILTSFPKGKRRLYVAESPEKLKFMIEELKTDFEKISSELSNIYNRKESRPVVKYLEGKKGIIFVWDDVVRTLKKGDIFYRYSSSKKDRGDYLSNTYRKIRDQKELGRLVITNVERINEKKRRYERAEKAVPPEFDLFDYDISEVIYGDKIAYVDYNTETAFIIESPHIAEFQRKIFKLLYNKLE